ncbi:hypothetical protein CMV_025064 [Castanea mollissima]|uniref:F-box domain-containing protein n=1 Tax=Castanea mollissima TaxID=60419 RepID=A0A8J4QGU3_9ROSI|nr:hypothetical protein CMV_025064 [Castanea mollissima]
MCCPRGRGLGENEEQSIVDLDQDTLRNVLERVDAVTLLRAEGVNKLWRKVARDDRLWEPIALRLWAGSGKLECIDEMTHYIRFRAVGFRTAVRHWIYSYVGKPNLNTPSDYNSIPDFYSIDPQVFSSQIGPWVQN